MYCYQKDKMELLCVAAMLNGTLLAGHDKQVDFKHLVLVELDDYFRDDNFETRQFSYESTKAFIESLTETELLRLLHEMGKCPFGDAAAKENKWEEFVERVAGPEV